MTPYSVIEGFIGEPHERLLTWVRRQVQRMPDGFTCHEVCERLTIAYEEEVKPRVRPADLEQVAPPFRHVRGKFNYYDHSWLEIVGTRLIIDPYPWACGSGPLLLVLETGSPWTTLYRESE